MTALTEQSLMDHRDDGITLLHTIQTTPRGSIHLEPNMKGDIDKRNGNIGANKQDDEWS